MIVMRLFGPAFGAECATHVTQSLPSAVLMFPRCAPVTTTARPAAPAALKSSSTPTRLAYSKRVA